MLFFFFFVQCQIQIRYIIPNKCSRPAGQLNVKKLIDIKSNHLRKTQLRGYTPKTYGKKKKKAS